MDTVSRRQRSDVCTSSSQSGRSFCIPQTLIHILGHCSFSLSLPLSLGLRKPRKRCVGVFAHGEARFKYWMESDAADAEAKLADAVAAPGAWHAVNWEVCYPLTLLSTLAVFRFSLTSSVQRPWTHVPCRLNTLIVFPAALSTPPVP